MPNLMTDLCLDISHSCVEAEESNLPRRCPVELDLLPLKQPQVQSLQFPWLKQLYTNSIAECCDKASSVTGIDVNQIPASTESDDPNTHSPSSSHSPFLLEGVRSKRELSKKMQELDDRICEMNSRGASDDEEGSCNPRKKLRLSKEQSALLEESFKEQSTLNPQKKRKQALAKQLSLRPRQVEVWFQNRRARTKLKQTELDCELLKHCCESLSEENRRLQRELQELRAMKLTPPHVGAAQDFFMPLPATSLTICPSCERLATLHNQPSSRVTKYTQSSAA